MCVIKITRWRCRCEHREVADCDKFKKQKANAVLKMLVRARMLGCQNLRYEVTPKKDPCGSRECPKKKRHVDEAPVVLKRTARGTTDFRFSDHRAAPPPPPSHHKTRANNDEQQQQMRQRRTKDRAPPAADLKRSNGRHLPKHLEETLDDPRSRFAERPKKVELPKLGNVAERKGVQVKPRHRIVSQHAAVVSESPLPQRRRSSRQPTQLPPVQAPAPTRPRRESRPTQQHVPPVPFKNHARRSPEPNVPLRPKAPVHAYEYRRRRYNPIARSPSPPRHHERRRSCIPEPILKKTHRHEAPAQFDMAAAPTPAPVRVPRERVRPSFDNVPHNPMPNPIFANKQKKEKKQGLFQRIMKKLDLDDAETNSDLSFQCVGLSQEQLARMRKSHGEGTWWNNDFVMTPR